MDDSRIERFMDRLTHPEDIRPRAPWIIESPVERAMMGLACAVEELNQAIIYARTPDALCEMRDSAGEAITRLCVVSDVCVTLAKYFGEQPQ